MKKTDVMAKMLEVKHRQLCLARMGLSQMVFRAPAERKAGEDNFRRYLDEIIEAAESVGILKREYLDMEEQASKVTHEDATKDFIRDMFQTIMMSKKLSDD